MLGGAARLRTKKADRCVCRTLLPSEEAAGRLPDKSGILVLVKLLRNDAFMWTAGANFIFRPNDSLFRLFYAVNMQVCKIFYFAWKYDIFCLYIDLWCKLNYCNSFNLNCRNCLFDPLKLSRRRHEVFGSDPCLAGQSQICARRWLRWKRNTR